MTENANRQALVTVGVGAVVFRGEEVLLIRRGREPFLGHWSIPGGKLHFGETLADAVTREVREETGVEIRIIGLIGAFEALPRETGGAAGHMVLIDYAAEWVDGEPMAGDDALAAEFVPFDEAMNLLAWDKTRTALAQAIDIRRAASKTL